MKSLRSTRFGDLMYAEGDAIELANGLVGLPRLCRWILLDVENQLPLRWLQSLDDPGFSVPVISPDFFGAGELVEAAARAAGHPGGQAGGQPAVLVITTVHQGGTRLTGNLAAPLVIDTETRRGAQVVMDDRIWPLRKEIDYIRYGLAVQGEGLSTPAPGDAKTTNEARQEISL